MAEALSVFVCGTSRDMQDERAVIRNALDRSGLRYFTMERFGAREYPPLATCLDEVRKCDVLVAIVGHTYGSMEEQSGLSFSQLEYEEAVRHKKIVLAYLKDESLPIAPEHIEEEQRKVELLARWKTTITKTRTAYIYTSVCDLGMQLLMDLWRLAEQKAEKKLQSHILMQIIDPLTGLLNRHGLFAETNHRRLQNATGLCALIDIDKFKQINDRYGHKTGDRLLTAAGELLRNTVGDDSIIARNGGDEFVVRFPEQSSIEEITILQEYVEQLPAHLAKERLPQVTCTVGVSLDRFDDFMSKLQEADWALYEGKRSGGNVVMPIDHAAAERLKDRKL